MYRALTEQRAGRPAEPLLGPFSRVLGISDVVPRGPRLLSVPDMNPEQLATSLATTGIKMPRGKKAHPFSYKPEKRDPPCKYKMCRQKKGPQCKYVLDEYVN